MRTLKSGFGTLLFAGFLLSCLYPMNGLMAQSAGCNTLQLQEHLELVEKAGLPNQVGHFACLYSRSDTFLNAALNGINHERSGISVLAFSCEFAGVFAKAYIDAADSFSNGYKLQGNWRMYFSETRHNAIACYLVGASTHINADMPIELAKNAELAELKKFRHTFRKLNIGFKNFARLMMNEQIQSNRRIRRINNLTLGAGKLLVYRRIRHWRMRAYRTALRSLRRGEIPYKRILNRTERINRKLYRWADRLAEV